MRKQIIEKEEAKQVFAQIFGIKKGDWVKKKWHGRKNWVVVRIHNSPKGRRTALCWRRRKTPYHFYETVADFISLTNLILIRDHKKEESIAIPRN